MNYHFRIFVYLAGDAKYHLCTVESPESAAAVIAALCRAERPEFMRLEVELFRPTPGI